MNSFSVVFLSLKGRLYDKAGCFFLSEFVIHAFEMDVNVCCTNDACFVQWTLAIPSRYTDMRCNDMNYIDMRYNDTFII